LLTIGGGAGGTLYLIVESLNFRSWQIVAVSRDGT